MPAPETSATSEIPEHPGTGRACYRALFISDLHMGSRGFKAAAFLAFLKSVDCRTLYLVGDIFDLEHISRRRVHWTGEASRVVRRLLKMALHATRIVYLTGNHDEGLQQFAPLALNSHIQLVERAEHVTATGERLLVIHGHQFDPIVSHARWLTHLGSHLYDGLLALNHLVYHARRTLGFRSYWSLSAHLKHRAKQAVSFIADFEKAALATASHGGYRGVVTGHIHTPRLATEGGLIYANCGDWVESLSAVAELDSGELRLLRWG